MCGIAGFFDPRAVLPSEEWEGVLFKMGTAISYRGPDDSGVWFDFETGIGLSHRRLSILDRSSAGHQPMSSHSGRYELVFNGEIYNHLEIRRELSIDNWRGYSDTETLLVGFDTWGVLETLKRAVGMFAMAIWDRKERVLKLARDRIGEKPLYYGWQGEVFLFGSELKALVQHPAFLSEVNTEAVSEYIKLACVPAPFSIYKGISKLLPGHILEINCAESMSEKLVPFWSLREVARDEVRGNFKGNFQDAIVQTELILRDSIRSQLISDVPLGAFLSGGVDSSLVVALMQQELSGPVKTFTMGFYEESYNETKYASAVAKHFGTEHTEEYVSANDALSLIPKMPSIYDEPFADSSQIPTVLLSIMTKKHVTVCLSGDGGDELFGGYNRHYYLPLLNKFPHLMRKILALPIGAYNAMFHNSSVSHQRQKLLKVLGAKGFDEMYFALLGESTKEQLLARPQESASFFKENIKFNDLAETVMFRDTSCYLPDDILVKVDRASMSASLESRAPYLDHRLVEFAWSLPMSMKIRNGRGKWVLRQILNKYLPIELINRPKMGFAVPIAEWLRGPLRPWAEDLLDCQRMTEEGFFNAKVVQKIWGEHQRREYNWKTQLWSILMFQSWLRENGKPRK